MRTLLVPAALIAPALLLASVESRHWSHVADITAEPGKIVALDLPESVYAHAAPGLADLRLFDAAGAPIPYLLERRDFAPTYEGELLFSPKNFRAEIIGSDTILWLETGSPAEIDRIDLETPSSGFLKTVTVETSDDGETWTVLAANRPIFRQPDGAQGLSVALPKGARKFLRVAIDDTRAAAVPFTGARLHSAKATVRAGSDQRVRIDEARLVAREDAGGVTRLKLDLGAENLPLAAVSLVGAQGVFSRPVRLVYPVPGENGPTETEVARGRLFRNPPGGDPPTESLSLRVDHDLPSREVTLIIENGDSPPPVFSSVSADRRVRRVIFSAPTGGARLAVGNALAVAPQYDLAALAAAFRKTALTPAVVGPLDPNPGFTPAKPIAPPFVAGAPFDRDGRTYRREVVARPGEVCRLAPDFDILAASRPDLGDLRLESAGRQVPFLFDEATRVRLAHATEWKPVKSTRAGVSRFRAELPGAGTPVRAVSFVADVPAFSRRAKVFRETTSARDGVREVLLTEFALDRNANGPVARIHVSLFGAGLGDKLILEIVDGDDAPLPIRDFRIHLDAPTLVFVAPPAPAALTLWYGHAEATRPDYADLRAQSASLLKTPSAPVTLGAPARESPGFTVGRAGPWIFGGALAAVVVVLLAVLRRMLPEPPKN